MGRIFEIEDIETGQIFEIEEIDSPIQTDPLDSPSPQSIQLEQTRGPQRSPVGFSDRMALDFGTPKGQFNFLKNKFGQDNVRVSSAKKFGADPLQEGQETTFEVNTGQGFQPVDPKTGFDPFSLQGIKEGMLDVADVPAEAIRQGTGLIGGLIGSALDPGKAGGFIIGEGIGRGVGEAFNKSIANFMGLRPEEGVGDSLSDVVKETGIGVATAGLIPGGKAAGKNLLKNKAIARGVAEFSGDLAKSKQFLKNAYDKTIGNFFRELYSFNLSMKDEFIDQMRNKGARLILNDKARNWRDFIQPTLKKLQGAVPEFRKRMGSLWEHRVRPDFKQVVPAQKVNNQVFQKALSSVDDTQQGSDLFRSFISEQAERLGIKQGGNVPPELAGTISITPDFTFLKTINKGSLWDLRKRIDDQLINWDKAGTKTNYLERAAKGLRSDIDQILKDGSVRFKIGDKLYSQSMEFINDLPRRIQKGDRTNMESLEAFLNRFPNLPQGTKQIIKELDDKLPGNKKFLNDALTFGAAEAWYKNTWRVFRPSVGFGAAGLLGGGPAIGLMATGTAVLLSNPRLVLKLLSTKEGAQILASNLVKLTTTAGGVLGPRIAAAKLSNQLTDQ